VTSSTEPVARPRAVSDLDLHAASAPGIDPEPSIELSVVIPTYRGQESLAELVDRLDAVLDGRGVQSEIIIVNDASPDATWKTVQQLAEGHQRVTGIDLLSNHGQARATLCGLAFARGAVVATIDDDLQQFPEDLDAMLDTLDEHPEWDAAVGTWRRDQGSPLKRVGSWIHAVTDRYAHGTPKGFRHTSFRVMRRPLVDALVAHDTRTPVMGPLITQLSGQVHNVPVRHVARPYGSSTITIRESITRVTNNIIHGTTLPLRLLARLGIIAAGGSILAAGYLLLRYMFGAHPPEGWASVFLATVFFGGASLLGIATIGRYLSVIVEETRGRPKYAIRATAGEPPDPNESASNSRGAVDVELDR
jgi:dolichol-phosphate mannosyltransferase/undecaprenyl-phosphate 4-deoxy-4-formamido-L-arabinose transferase